MRNDDHLQSTKLNERLTRLTPRERLVSVFAAASVLGTFLLHPMLKHAMRPADAFLALSMLATVVLLPDRIRVPRWMLLGLILLAGGGAVSAFWTGAAEPILTLAKTTWVWIWAICLVVVGQLPGGRRLLCTWLAASAAVGAFMTLLVTHGHQLGPATVLARHTGRPSGPYDNPNMAASHLLIGIVLIPLHFRRGLMGAGWVAAWCVCLWTLWSGQSLAGMGGLLGALFALLAMAATTRPFAAKKWLIVLAVFAAGVACWQISLLYSDRPRGKLATPYRIFKLENKMAGRNEGDRASLRLWTSSPVVGVGRGRAHKQILARNVGKGGGHNEYLTTLAEAGVVGLAGLMLLWGTPIVRGIGTLRRGDPDSDITALCLCALIGELIIAWTHDIVHFRHVWVLIAILLAAGERTRAK